MTSAVTNRATTRRHRIPVLVMGFAALLLCVVVSLALGARSVWVAAVVQALLGDGSSRDAMVVTEMRLPRTFVGVAVVSCDLIAQRALPIEGFPVGVITATVGAPCLLILMLRESGPAHRGTA